MNEPNDNLIDETMELRKVLLSELGDFVVPVVSLVSEPSVPWARYISIKSAAKTEEKNVDVDLSQIHPLALARVAKKISQTELSRSSGVPQSTISSIENGRPASQEVALKMAAPLGVTADSLVFATGIAAVKAKASDDADPRSALYAASAAYDLSQDSGLSQEQRDIAAKLCQDLLKSVEAGLGIDPEQVQELQVAEKSAEEGPRGVERDERGVPLDTSVDLRRHGWK